MVSLKMQEVLLSGAECLFDINIQCTFTQTRNTDSYDYFFYWSVRRSTQSVSQGLRII